MRFYDLVETECRNNDNRINTEKGLALVAIMGRYKGERRVKKTRNTHTNLTKSPFNSLSIGLIEMIASFIPGVVRADSVNSKIKIVTERICKKEMRDLMRKSMMDLINKNIASIYTRACISISQKWRDTDYVPNSFFKMGETIELKDLRLKLRNKINNDATNGKYGQATAITNVKNRQATTIVQQARSARAVANTVVFLPHKTTGQKKQHDKKSEKNTHIAKKEQAFVNIKAEVDRKEKSTDLRLTL